MKDISSGQIVGVTCEASRAHSKARTGRQTLFYHLQVSISSEYFISNFLASFLLFECLFVRFSGICPLCCISIFQEIYTNQTFKNAISPYKNQIKNLVKSMEFIVIPPFFNLIKHTMSLWYSIFVFLNLAIPSIL